MAEPRTLEALIAAVRDVVENPEPGIEAFASFLDQTRDRAGIDSPDRAERGAALLAAVEEAGSFEAAVKILADTGGATLAGSILGLPAAEVDQFVADLEAGAPVSAQSLDLDARVAALKQLDIDTPYTFTILQDVGRGFRNDGTGLLREVDPQTGEILPNAAVFDPISQIISEIPFPEGEQAPLPPFIGGFSEIYAAPNPDYSASVAFNSQFDRFRQYGLAGDYDAMTRDVPEEFRDPLYRSQDQWSMFAGKTPEYIATVQQQMIDAGVLDKGDSVPGYWGDREAAAMSHLMTEANATGSKWFEAAANRAAALAALTPEQRALRAGRSPFVAPAYLAPDYATLAQAVRSTFAQRLGRDPEDYELALLADQLGADFRNQYGAELAAARSEYDAGNRAIIQETAQSAGSFTGVDPMARLGETMLARYQPEIDRYEAVGEMQANSRNLMQSLAGLQSFVGG